MTTEQRIVKWNTDRNITDKPTIKLMTYCFIEELLEMMGIHHKLEKQKLKKLANTYADYLVNEMEFFGAKPTEEDIVDALCDINVFADGFISRNGYSPDIAMDETIKEIESRTGDFDDTGKWVKHKEQANPYKADYTKAKH